MNNFLLEAKIKINVVEITFSYDESMEKMWIDRENLIKLSNINNVILSRKISNLTITNLIDVNKNIRYIRDKNSKRKSLYDNEVLKNIIDYNTYLMVIERQKLYIKDYKINKEGKVFFKNDILDINYQLFNYPEMELTEYDINKLFHTSIMIGNYKIDDLIEIGLKNNYPNKDIFINWSKSILTKVLLDGYYIDNKIKGNRKRIIEITRIADSLLNIDDYIPLIKYNDQLYNTYSFLKSIFLKAKNKIVIISKYINESIFPLLNGINVMIYLYTSNYSYILDITYKMFKKNHMIDINTSYNDFKTYIIIDDSLFYFDCNMINILYKYSNCISINKDVSEFMRQIKKA